MPATTNPKTVPGIVTGSTALIVGEFRDYDREQIAVAAGRSGTTMVFISSVQRALTRLRSGHEPPICVLAAPDLNVRQLIDGVRDQAEMFGVPVLVVLARASADGYREAYLAGPDDVLVGSDVGGLTRRLANLGLHRSDVRPDATLGRAVIASRDEAARRRLGRTLRQVGFAVDYASDLRELARMTSEGEAPTFAVTTEPLSADLVAVPERGPRNIGKLGEVPVMYVGPNELAAPTKAGDQVADVTGRLLFFADEQAKAKFKDRRVSARKLYAAVCSFREGGSLHPIYGVTHNISREGMYVRTLDPPRPDSTIWLELQAPVNEKQIHLRARAMWQRLPGSGKGVLPPGFGLLIEAGQCPPPDLQAFVEGYEVLPE
jgi:CheY-like chemotaxis protein